jgi:hypothetical protein
MYNDANSYVQKWYADCVSALLRFSTEQFMFWKVVSMEYAVAQLVEALRY